MLMPLAAIFGQTFELQDMAIVGLLVVLEGVLSIDNALVLGLLAKRLPHHLQKRALTYGLVGAFVFRFIAIAMAALLFKWWVVKLLGGGYLIYVAVKHLFSAPETSHGIKIGPDGQPIMDAQTPADLAESTRKLDRAHAKQFWSAVIAIELTDIAFAVDSILAAIALVAGGKLPEHGFHPKLWVVIVGGMLGVILMRFAAIVFIRLLDRFPRFELAAYLLVLVIGAKLLVDWWFNKPPDPEPAGWHPPADFHTVGSPAFLVFWGLMAVCFAVGFLPKRRKPIPAALPPADEASGNS